MDRVDTLIQKVDTIERFCSGEIQLSNYDAAVTTMFNNFVKYLLEEWVEAPISCTAATPLGKRLLWHINQPGGLQRPTHERVIASMKQGETALVPLLAVRYLLRNKNLSIVMQHVTDDWRHFTLHYKGVFDTLDGVRFYD